MKEVLLSRFPVYLGAIFIFFIFAALNADLFNFAAPSLTGLLLIAGVFLFQQNKTPLSFNFLTAAGGTFLLFQAVKLAVAIVSIVAKKDVTLLSKAYSHGMLFYLCEALIMFCGFQLMCSKNRALFLLKTFVFCSFFISLNAVLPLVQNSYGYKLGTEGVFFFPALYQIPFSEHIFGRWWNMNWAGDFVVFGIFSGLGLIFYDLYRGSEKKEKVAWIMTLAIFFITAINSSVLLLLKSRGSIVFFAAALIFFLVLLSFKWACRYKVVLIAVFIAMFFGVTMWMGNFKGAVQEVQTISGEVKDETRSWAVNLEAQKRALRMFKDQPVFGIGRGNYLNVSEQYADLGVDADRTATANFSCMSHYFLMLAEEGSGSFIYFLFMAAFVFFIFTKAIQTKSQFQFLAGVSLLSAVLMVLGHATINDILDHFGMASLVYLTLGMLAALFRKDFDHS